MKTSEKIRIIFFITMALFGIGAINVKADSNITAKNPSYSIAGGDHDVPGFFTQFNSGNGNMGTAQTIPDGYVELGLARLYTYFGSGTMSSGNSYTYKFRICGGSQNGKIGPNTWGTTGGDSTDPAWKQFVKGIKIYRFMYNTSSEAITGAADGDPSKLVSEVQTVSGSTNCIYHVITLTPESNLRAVGFFIQYGSSTGFFDGDSNNKINISLISLTEKTGVAGVISAKTDKQIEEQQKTNEHLSDIEDTLTDDDTSDAQDTIGNFFQNFTTNDHGLSSIITAPLSAIQSLSSATCSPISLPLPFMTNKNLILPCMRSIYDQHFGAFMQLYDVITFGIVGYWVCVRIFTLVKDFKNPEHDEVEVMDL